MPEIQPPPAVEQKQEKDPVMELKDQYFAAQSMSIQSIVELNYLGLVRDKVNALRYEKNIPTDQTINQIFDEARDGAKLDAVFREDGRTLKNIESGRSKALGFARQARELKNSVDVKTQEIAKTKEEKERQQREADKKESADEKIKKEQAEGRSVKEWLQKEADSQKADSLIWDTLMTGVKSTLYQKYGTLGSYFQQIDSFVDNPRMKLPTYEEFNSAYEEVYHHYAIHPGGHETLSALEHFRSEYAGRLGEMLKIQPIRLKRLSK